MVNSWQLKTRLLVAGAIGFSLTSPLAILGLWNDSLFGSRAADSVALFGLLWVLSSSSVLVALTSGQNLRSRHPTVRSAAAVGGRLVLLLLLAAVWTTITVDQLPCLMGVPNCD